MTNDANEAAKKRLAEDNAVTEETRRQYAERMKGKPTPTQAENDLAALGAHILEHEDDGSGPDPFITPRQAEAAETAEASEAKKPREPAKPAETSGSYQTRQSQPARHSPPTPPPHGGSGSSSS